MSLELKNCLKEAEQLYVGVSNTQQPDTVKKGLNSKMNWTGEQMQWQISQS